MLLLPLFAILDEIWGKGAASSTDKTSFRVRKTDDGESRRERERQLLGSCEESGKWTRVKRDCE